MAPVWHADRALAKVPHEFEAGPIFDNFCVCGGRKDQPQHNLDEGGKADEPL